MKRALAAPSVRSPGATRLGTVLDALPWAGEAGPFRGLGFKFKVRATDPVLSAHVQRILGSLATEEAPQHSYSVVDRGTGTRARRVRTYLDHQRVATSSSDGALAYVLWHLNRSVLGSAPAHLLVHAAALEHHGDGVLLPGPSGSGKSTLAAALVMGGMGYLSDEVAAVDPARLVLVPFPKPLTLKEGSWDVLAELAPAVDAVPAAYRERQWHVDPRTIRPRSIAGPCRPRLMVFPCYHPGATTRLAPLGRAEAVAKLAANAFSLPFPGQQGLGTMAELVRDCLAFTLVVGDLDEACATITSL